MKTGYDSHKLTWVIPAYAHLILLNIISLMTVFASFERFPL